MSNAVLVQEKVIEAPIGKPKRKIQYKLQALRGIASLAVIWHHIGSEGYLDKVYKLDLGFVPYGNIRPLLFFMLSGYMVSLTNKSNLSSWEEIRYFGQKRLYRLYPIYFIVVLCTFLLNYDKISINQILSNLLFLQSFTNDVVFENRALWTMSFEVMFYFVFVLISFFNIKKFYVPLGALIIGIGLLLTNSNFPMLISVCFGLVYWGCGLLCGGIKWKSVNHAISNLIALALLIFCYQQLEVSAFVLKKLPHSMLPMASDFIHHPIKFIHLAFIPVCYLVIQSFNSKEVPF
ncbi:acyltransferase family protein [Rufibacter glacialis]|uniref:Acyltransferase family protein n=1 Tax=Rufibacter glacialis TaxID=1259555 RepID=A0ABV4RK79_9BACT|nr:acyltransferase [Rufibacter glacialis]GGK56785.1 hypothetical protein GCM10011405_01140 [Rufibacter glacialis]